MIKKTVTVKVVSDVIKGEFCGLRTMLMMCTDERPRENLNADQFHFLYICVCKPWGNKLYGPSKNTCSQLLRIGKKKKKKTMRVHETVCAC